MVNEIIPSHTQINLPLSPYLTVFLPQNCSELIAHLECIVSLVAGCLGLNEETAAGLSYLRGISASLYHVMVLCSFTGIVMLSLVLRARTNRKL